MRRALLAAVLLAAACTAGPPPAGTAPIRLLIAGSVDLGGAAASVAAADPEGVLRQVRLAARRADLAVVVAAPPAAEELLASAGFDAVVCPQVHPLAPSGAGNPGGRPAGSLEIILLCPPEPGPGLGRAGPLRSLLPSSGPTLAVVAGPPAVAPSPGLGKPDIVVALTGTSPSVTVVEPGWGRTTLVVSGLGSLLSAAGDPAARAGWLLEVLVDRAGVIAYRLGATTHPDLRVHFIGWELPTGDAVLLEGEWWALVRPVTPAPVPGPADPAGFDRGELTAASMGDVTGDGEPDIAAAYRHPFRPSALSEYWTEAVPVDALGRSAHLGVFDTDWGARWAAGRLPHPVGALAACDGSVALAYTGLDDPRVVATGAAVWEGLGLRSVPELPGPGVAGCADVDGDGLLDPLILERSP